LFLYNVLVQSIVDCFGGQNDMVSLYVRLKDNKLFLSDEQRTADYQLARVKVGLTFFDIIKFFKRFAASQKHFFFNFKLWPFIL